MIQRVQSLFLFFAAVISLVILFYAPVFIQAEGEPILIRNFRYPALFLLISVLLSLYSIFRFKNRLRQLMIVNLSRLSITISFFLLILFKEENQLYFGSFLLVLPYIILLISSYFIKKDDKLVRSADRIR
ncbi:MAG: hypothetical protein CMD22_00375 [Flavobacteriales bacterium]|nr:hypothetical protein [Flavobacteriales bacterium]|tara:strand:+ start:1536 stop:1925 length:390 start_codon:yes stop_codon:yes gene_type:complete